MSLELFVRDDGRREVLESGRGCSFGNRKGCAEKYAMTKINHRASRRVKEWYTTLVTAFLHFTLSFDSRHSYQLAQLTFSHFKPVHF